MTKFLTSLLETGRVAVDASLEALDNSDAATALVEFDHRARNNLAGDAPEFNPESALWGASCLYRSCQLIVCRDVSEAEMNRLLRVPCPGQHCPATDYSVDLTLQYLPDVIGLAKRVAFADPLLRELLSLAREWPLSSVGVEPLESLSLDGFIGHPGLAQLYVDRILARGDYSRLGDARVDSVARETLGAFPDLCPQAFALVGQLRAEKTI